MHCYFVSLDWTNTIFRVPESLWKGSTVKNLIILKCRYHNKIKFIRSMNLFLVQNGILFFKVLFIQVGCVLKCVRLQVAKKYYGELGSGQGSRKSFWQFWSGCILTSNGIFVFMLGTNRPEEDSITNKELWMMII